MNSSGYSVGAVAGLAGITVRTLHHYDEIGLLSPSERTAAGYRCYTESDLDRLRHILCYRELGFSLDAIAAIVHDPGADALAHLKKQRAMLVERIERLQRMVVSVDHVTEAKELGMSLTPEEKLEVFGGYTEPAGYAEWAARQWGDTPEWQAGQEITKSFGKREWAEAERVREEWSGQLLSIMDSGARPDSVEAMDLLERHRLLLGQFMGECRYEMHLNLTALYVTEPGQLGFLVREPDQRPGMAEFIRDAAKANAERAGS
ncbi:MerR family transcriptional regulator [Amycolatopsis nigrescens]|uniref:MerR family transcriptional regulator n=1 Tax=Amycolatopsis nigrescens TaxID=381445 RepID=UPI0003719531|nr:MerR family transcriptional regulator [Amycolatopsis nigrescens]